MEISRNKLENFFPNNRPRDKSAILIGSVALIAAATASCRVHVTETTKSTESTQAKDSEKHPLLDKKSALELAEKNPEYILQNASFLEQQPYNEEVIERAVRSAYRNHSDMKFHTYDKLLVQYASVYGKKPYGKEIVEEIVTKWWLAIESYEVFIQELLKLPYAEEMLLKLAEHRSAYMCFLYGFYRSAPNADQVLERAATFYAEHSPLLFLENGIQRVIIDKPFGRKILLPLFAKYSVYLFDPHDPFDKSTFFSELQFMRRFLAAWYDVGETATELSQEELTAFLERSNAKEVLMILAETQPQVFAKTLHLLDKKDLTAKPYWDSIKERIARTLLKEKSYITLLTFLSRFGGEPYTGEIVADLVKDKPIVLLENFDLYSGNLWAEKARLAAQASVCRDHAEEKKGPGSCLSWAQSVSERGFDTLRIPWANSPLVSSPDDPHTRFDREFAREIREAAGCVISKRMISGNVVNTEDRVSPQIFHSIVTFRDQAGKYIHIEVGNMQVDNHPPPFNAYETPDFIQINADCKDAADRKTCESYFHDEGLDGHLNRGSQGRDKSDRNLLTDDYHYPDFHASRNAHLRTKLEKAYRRTINEIRGFCPPRKTP